LGTPSGHRSQVDAEDEQFFYVNPTDRFGIGGADCEAGLAGAKQPSGMALKLRSVVEKHGLETLT